MAKRKFSYTLERGKCWNHYAVEYMGHVIVDFKTDKRDEGMFEATTEGFYRQVAGTCDFRMPDSDNACRNVLRRMALERIKYDPYMEEI